MDLMLSSWILQVVWSDEEMMNENVHKAIQPNETLFVVDAMTGQDGKYSKSFNDRLNFDG
jgi:signal recognition particle subunit SRP54